MAEISAELHMNAAAPMGDYGKGRFETLEEVLHRLEQLDSPPAMAWQDEPSGDGMHYVEGWGSRPIRVSQFKNEAWSFVNPFSQAWCHLNGRRVCPIPAPPTLPKRGDS
jgi:hypothetical protein